MTVIALAGRIGHRSADDLSAEIARVLASAERRVVVDLEQVDYISSAGLTALASASEQARARGGVMLVSGVAAPVRTALELAALAARLAIEPSRAEAVDRLAGWG